MSYDPPPADPSPVDSPPPAAPLRPPGAYAEPGFPPPAHIVAPVAERPTLVTAAGMTMIVVGALFGLLGLLALLAAVLFGSVGGSVAEETGIAADAMGMAAGLLVFIAIIVLAIAVLDIVAGIKVLGGRSWARITGIIIAAVLALLGVAGLGGGGSDSGSPVFGIVLLAANVFIVFALATTGSWFAARAPG